MTSATSSRCIYDRISSAGFYTYLEATLGVLDGSASNQEYHKMEAMHQKVAVPAPVRYGLRF